MKQQIAYLFDVDGVLSDPVEKRVVELDLFTELDKRLLQGDPVALNTGRSTSWMMERIITPLRERLSGTTAFEHFIAIGEKGGTWITFDTNGHITHGKDTSLAVPQTVKHTIKNLVEKKYAEAMFYDDTKELMVSVEMQDHFSIKKFHELQKPFVKEVEDILHHTAHHEHYKIDPSTISTDIEDKRAGKALGAQKFLSWLEEKQITPSKFETFGDSPSDMAMSDALAQRGKQVHMIYVGDPVRLGKVTRSYPVTFISGYSHGTLVHLTASERE